MDAASLGAGAPPAESFPPTDLVAFLRLCAGEWMSLRSRFALGEAKSEGDADGEGDEWHSSERGELQIHYADPAGAGDPGGLRVTPQGQPPQVLEFAGEGVFRSSPAAGGAAREGSWQLWPDGSLELTLAEDGIEVRERIWFTKPNLRLRSTVEHHADGTPGRASFSSEIRRVSRPAAPAA